MAHLVRDPLSAIWFHSVGIHMAEAVRELARMVSATASSRSAHGRSRLTLISLSILTDDSLSLTKLMWESCG